MINWAYTAISWKQINNHICMSSFFSKNAVIVDCLQFYSLLTEMFAVQQNKNIDGPRKFSKLCRFLHASSPFGFQKFKFSIDKKVKSVFTRFFTYLRIQ